MNISVPDDLDELFIGVLDIGYSVAAETEYNTMTPDEIKALDFVANLLNDYYNRRIKA